MEGDREYWALRIGEAGTREELEALDAELGRLRASWARAEQFRIANRKVQLKRAEGWVADDAFAAAYGADAPDGRWLYRYRLTQDGFERLQADLSQQAPARLDRGCWPGLFVLWASEWFRRCYRGGGHRWIDLADALGIVEDQGLFRRITAAGLMMWRRPVFRGGWGSEYLGSLAREGGFPVAAVEDGRGWAGDVLKAVVAPLLGEPAAGEERARELAAMQRPRLGQLFHDDDFIALCADLALAVVALRREADASAAAAGLPVVAWLELNRPGWRERLPLSAGDRGAEALIEGLLKVDAVSGAAVGVDRFLMHDGACWREAVRIKLDGALDSAATGSLDRSFGRLRVFAAGELSRSLPGELAMLDAPGEGETSWRARSARRSRDVHPVPFATPIEFDLRSGEQRVSRIALAAGKPRRGDVIVMIEDEPGLLCVIGSGSGKYRAETIIVQVPADWRVDAVADESVGAIGPGVGDRRLWRVTGGAFVVDPAGDRFRILCGQPQDEPSRIDLIGSPASWAEVSGNVDLFVGPPFARINGLGALHVREIGDRAWRPAPNLLPVGHYELGWRRDGILLDRRRIGVLPVAVELMRSGGTHPVYTLRGFGECNVDPDEDAPVRVTGDGRWVSQATRFVHWFTAHVEWPEGPALPVRIACPCAASIARWDGTVLPHNAPITLADLPGLVAVAEDRVQLVGELVMNGRRVAEMTWDVVDELPLSSIADDLASLLIPESIHAEVRLGMHDGIETWWRVKQFPVELTIDGGRVTAPHGVVEQGAQLAGRALANPTEERVFGDYSLLTDANHRPAILPPLAGDWLIYLRAGDSILSKPRFHRGGPPAAPPGVLGRAMANPPGPVLDETLLDLLAGVEGDHSGAAATVDAVLRLIVSLHGLPPATFRVLELLPRRPGALARLALAASAEQRDAVLALSDTLPFCWCTLSRDVWQAAQRQVFAHTMAQLEALGPEAPRYAKEAVDTVVSGLIERAPLLGPVLRPAKTEDFEMVVQAFMNRAVDSVPRSRGDRYRGRCDDLPAYLTRFDPGLIDTLDAPCAAAAAAAGRWAPDSDDIRHIKTVARNFPTYFADAFAARLEEIS